MSETEKQRSDPADELDLSPETVEDLDAEGDADVRGGIPTVYPSARRPCFSSDPKDC